ncbi:hypothetical protein MUY27_09990 [Mucilaginibacter sp. RS28]|uniref:SprT-like family protein n=2 Tax=Mucilaginibacter straminoryzae TaxID=2932774 RepID=A0A9X1X2P9_9SPHI|nr:hypothetical protein [Mucilaginibacter straminoryzae]
MGNYITGYKYSKGSVTHTIGPPAPVNNIRTNDLKKVNDVNCIIQTYYVSVTVNFSSKPKEVNTTYISYDYSEWHCYFSPPMGAGGPDGGTFVGISPGDYAFVGGGGPGGSAGIDCTPQDQSQKGKKVNGCPVPTPITVEVITTPLRTNYPCADALILQNLMQQQDYVSLITQFQTSQRPSLTWQNGTLPWNQYDSQTGKYTYQEGATGEDPQSGMGTSMIITLNTSLLDNSSQLFIASTMIHESLHAYLRYNINLAYYNANNGYNNYPDWFSALDAFYTIKGLPSNYADHYEMLTDYFNKAVGILSSWDQNRHTQKEYVMTMLYGLDTIDSSGVSADMKAIITQVFNDMKINNGITDSELNKFWRDNLNAKNSDRLPKSGC